jgi:hypothetical protein
MFAPFCILAFIENVLAKATCAIRKTKQTQEEHKKEGNGFMVEVR